jgi:hypothetical protein
MKILGPFLSIEDADTFFFMRGFPDLPSREPMKAKFYEGKLWKDELEKLVMPMLEKYEVVLVDDPEGFIRWQSICRSEQCAQLSRFVRPIPPTPAPILQRRAGSRVHLLPQIPEPGPPDARDRTHTC